ncbi:acyltransferase family protein [Pontibacter silvestris]|uniref:Acyltransferase family protein n=1 Tax=Pontibacter silvestris TaxID=2305183 RepID=A0ABW4X292_9BACT|nr:acyltransferase [Pontibacter silvestris]MCC9135754.1 acyltransferase [Pontibacter silvestris]
MLYIKQLDTVRAIAAILVILTHWLPIPYIQYSGFVGVNIFFVLSGFLITRILFEHRNEAEESGISKLTVFKNFFFRRALRILPIYFLMVFMLYLFGSNVDPKTDSELIYLSTFTINFHFYNLKYFGDLTAQCWSLAVEEQFYLLWPWVILYINKKYLLHAILAFILIGTTSQFFINDFEYGYLPTYTCFDAFGLGALLSWVMVYRPHLLNKTYKVLHLLVILSALLLAGRLSGAIGVPMPIRTLVSVIALWVITYLMYKSQTNEIGFSFLFNNKLLLFMGKISYGLYLYHISLPYIVWAFAKYMKPYISSLADNYLFYVFANVSLLFLVPWLSWRFIEKPFLSLKKYFVYQKAATPTPARAAV